LTVAFFERLDPRGLNMLLGGITLVVATALFSYLLWPQFKAYRTALESRDSLQSVVANDNKLLETLNALRNEVRNLRQSLHGDLAALPTKEMQGYIIGRLQGISWRNKVEFLGMQPRVGEPIEKFQEILFDVQLLGDYFDLYNWLRDASKELGFVVIKQYQMAPVSHEPEDLRLGVKMTMAVYRSET
jgi:Tfp pilus assembly protein PilO